MVSNNLEHGSERQTVPAHQCLQLHGYGKSLLARRLVFVEGNMAWVSSLAIVTGNNATETPRRYDTP